MKKHLLGSLAVATLIVGCRSAESQLGMGTQFKDMPMAAQNTVKQQIGNSQILDIDKESRSGRAVYEVTYESSPGIEKKMHVASDGSLLGDRQAGIREAAGSDNSGGHWEYRSGSGETRGGAQDQQFRGELRNDSSSFRSEAAAPSASVSTSSSDSLSAQSETKTVSANVGDAQASASLNTGAEPRLGTKMEDLPAAVQATLKQNAPSAQVDDIDKEMRTGRAVYEITFKDPGLNPKMHIAEDGTLLSDEQASALSENQVASAQDIELKREVRGGSEALLNGPSANAQIREDSGAELAASSTAQSAEFKADANADLNASKEGASVEIKEAAGADRDSKTHLSYNELPQAVQMKLNNIAADPNMAKIRKSTRDGKTVYEVKFKEIRISEDGTLMDKE